jgi:hypothetical protein
MIVGMRMMRRRLVIKKGLRGGEMGIGGALGMPRSMVEL